MNQANGPINRIKIGLVTVLGITLLVALTGCVGWVDGGGGYGGSWVVGLRWVVAVAAMTGGAMCMVIVIAELQVVRQRIPAPADMQVAAVAAVDMAVEEVSGEPHN